MDSFRTEEEQIEFLRTWWNENGISLIVGLIGALAIVGGYRYWNEQQMETKAAASYVYQELIDASTVQFGEQISEQNLAEVKQHIYTLKNQYSASSYAQWAALYAAKYAMEADDVESAEAELRWILAQGPESDVEKIVTARLARVLVAKGEVEAGLALIENVAAGEFSALYAELKGDLYVKLGRENEALVAYEQAELAAGDEALSPMLKMKLENLRRDETQIVPLGVLEQSPETAEADTTTAQEG